MTADRARDKKPNTDSDWWDLKDFVSQHLTVHVSYDMEALGGIGDKAWIYRQVITGIRIIIISFPSCNSYSPRIFRHKCQQLTAFSCQESSLPSSPRPQHDL
jgi:hypothetical protein